MDFLTVTKLTDPIEHRIPTGKAEEVAGEPTWLDAVDALICRELMNSDAVTNIPAAEAREVAYNKVRCVNRFEFASEDILRDLFGAHWEKKPNLAVSAENPFRAPEEFADPNAAMIARDEPEPEGKGSDQASHGSAAYCVGKFQNFRFADFKDEFRAYGTAKRIGSIAKPAIQGLTTVHDGKARGIGFCSEICDE